MLKFYVPALADSITQRRNNFTLIRLVLAASVLFAHSFPIVGAGSDPISLGLLMPQTWLGALAVNCFFVISGFLISYSASKNRPVVFIKKRLLRIYPALIAYIMISIFLIGPFISNMVPEQYWSNGNLVKLLISGYLTPWYFGPPDIFAANPFPNSYNGSLWTIPLELMAYGLVFVFFFGKMFRSNIFTNLCLLSILCTLLCAKSNLLNINVEERALEPLIHFLLGMLVYRGAKKIRLNIYFGLASLAVALIFQPILGSTAWSPFTVLVILTFAYRFPPINLDKLGDFSYGLYIWAWPAQQLFVTTGLSPYLNALFAVMVAMPMAVASWFFIEKPALKLSLYSPDPKRNK
jgi:peptidoglycan/LPS O-acetylase OafA/YrhL